jgi:hypothetical protein
VIVEGGGLATTMTTMIVETKPTTAMTTKKTVEMKTGRKQR